MTILKDLYRDPEKGRIAGVFAGLADYLEIPPARVRLAAIALAVFFPPHMLIGYAIAAVVLKRKPGGLSRATAEERFRHSLGLRPADACTEVATRFKAIDGRVIAVERYVTSAEFKLNREFRDLEGRS